MLRENDQSLVEGIRQGPSRRTAGSSEGRLKPNVNPCSWCGNAVSHPRTKCPAKKARCLNCGKYGHFKNVCRTKRVHNLLEDQSDKESAFLGGITHEVNGLPKPMVNVDINVVSLQFRVDTGADVTVISSKDYGDLKCFKLLRNDKVLNGPQNEPLTVVGKLETSLKCEDKLTVQKIYVIDKLFSHFSDGQRSNR